MAQLSAPLKTKCPKQEGRLAWVNLLGPDVTRLARVPHLDLVSCSGPQVQSTATQVRGLNSAAARPWSGLTQTKSHVQTRTVVGSRTDL